MHRRQHRCGAGHVAFHGVHAFSRLEVEAAGVKGDALAHQSEMELGPARRVAEPDQPWRPRRSTAHSHQAAIPATAQRVLIQHVHRDLAFAHQGSRLLGKRLRIEQIRWDVHPFAHRHHRLHDDLGGRCNRGGILDRVLVNHSDRGYLAAVVGSGADRRIPIAAQQRTLRNASQLI